MTKTQQVGNGLELRLVRLIVDIRRSKDSKRIGAHDWRCEEFAAAAECVGRKRCWS